jgi:hypothetical protein
MDSAQALAQDHGHPADAIRITLYGDKAITLSRQHNPQHRQRYENTLERHMDALNARLMLCATARV